MRVVLLAAALWAPLAAAAPGPQVAQVDPPDSAASPQMQPFPPEMTESEAPAAESQPAVPDQAPPPPAGEQAASTPSPPVDLPSGTDHLKYGVLLDVGIPDGAGLSGVYRPFYWLRASGGLTYNLLGFGVRAGVSLTPFYFPITPALSVEAGHFFESDATPILQRALPDTDLSAAGDALKHVSYGYANAHLGVELGSPRRFIFFLRAGISYIQTEVAGFQQAIRNASGDETIEAKPLKVRATLPSLKLGFLLYL